MINGVDYPLTPDEWMFDPQTTSLAQGGSQMKFSMGPLGPQMMAQLEGPQNATALAHTDAKADAKTDRPLSKSRAKMLARGKEFKSSKKNSILAFFLNRNTIKLKWKRFFVTHE